jgi:hypothetical protein
MAAAAGAPQYLAVHELQPNRFYKIEHPITFQERDDDENPVGPLLREVMVSYGKFLRLQDGFPVFALNGGAQAHYYNAVSTDPIDIDDVDDNALRFSVSGKEIVVSKLLASKVPEDAWSKIRRHMGGKKSRKTRRKGKKTLRRK